MNHGSHVKYALLGTEFPSSGIQHGRLAWRMRPFSASMLCWLPSLSRQTCIPPHLSQDLAPENYGTLKLAFLRAQNLLGTRFQNNFQEIHFRLKEGTHLKSLISRSYELKVAAPVGKIHLELWVKTVKAPKYERFWDPVIISSTLQVLKNGWNWHKHD